MISIINKVKELINILINPLLKVIPVIVMLGNKDTDTINDAIIVGNPVVMASPADIPDAIASTKVY